MHPRYLLAVASVVSALSACASSRQEAGTADAAVARGSTATSAAAQWSATLTAQSGTNVSGSATVAAAENAQQTRASVNLSGAEAGAVHPWHIHSGRCGDNGPIVGPAAEYPPLNVGSDGTAAATATLPFATPMSGNYYVNVHRSPTEMGTIVACGNLAMGGQ